MHGVEDFAICRRLHVPSVPRPMKHAIIVRWKPTPPGWYKLNIDRSYEAGRIYVGCIVRNSEGFFVAAFSITLGRGLVLDAEILAGMHTFIFPWPRRWPNLWLETDCELAMKFLMSSGNLIPWRIKACWPRFDEATHNINFCVSHIYREGNYITDMLSKLHIDNIWNRGCLDFL